MDEFNFIFLNRQRNDLGHNGLTRKVQSPGKHVNPDKLLWMFVFLIISKINGERVIYKVLV